MGATLADHAAGDSAIGDIRAEFVLPFFFCNLPTRASTASLRQHILKSPPI